MCKQLQVEGRDDLIETQHDLAELLGGADAVILDRRLYVDPVFQPDMCLCPVDVSGSLAAKGYAVRSGWATHGVDLYASKLGGKS